MLTALALTAYLLTQAPAAPPPQGANLASSTTRRKSTSLLLAGASLGAAAVGGYLALAVGVAANFRNQGLSSPPDADDILLLMVLPATVAAAVAWTVGLLDLAQRGLVSSALWSVLGAAAGELLGLGIGSLVGRSLYPSDPSASAIVTLFLAPAFAALGAVILMELLKPGEEVASGRRPGEGARGWASLSVSRTRGGGLAVGPALGLSF
jgi:hypothetical protein